MAYLHIENLYKNKTILLFKEVYSLEKIHGTSANIKWDGTHITYFSGGVNYENFIKLFDGDKLRELCGNFPPMVVFGEAYGGKCQGMSHTYGKELRFVAFDVLVNTGATPEDGRIGRWLCVPAAQDVVGKLGLEFVHYEKGPATVEWLDEQKMVDSVQAVRNGVGEGKMREGVVIRPLEEMTLNNGSRVIAKHKRDEFKETATPRKVDEGKERVLVAAYEVALEWVTPMRLQHVLDKLPQTNADPMSLTGEVIKSMVEDVEREAAGEVEWTKDVRKAVGARAAKMYKEHVSRII